MNRKWIMKIGVLFLMFMLITACGTTNDKNNEPIEDEAPINEQDDNRDNNLDNDDLRQDDNRDNDNLEEDNNFDNNDMDEDRNENDNLNE